MNSNLCIALIGMAMLQSRAILPSPARCVEIKFVVFAQLLCSFRNSLELL